MSDQAERDQGDRRERERRTSRAYREAHAEHIAKSKKEWVNRNTDRIKQYRETYAQGHRDQINARAREYERRKRAEARAVQEAQDKKERRRAYSRDYYAKNREAYLEQQRQLRAKRKTEDPDRYRAQARARNNRWYDTHRDERNEKLRKEYAENPEALRAKARAQYAKHADEVVAKRRAAWAANPEGSRERQRVQRERLRRRRDAGLPTKALHRVTRRETATNDTAADAFFARRRTTREIERMLRGPTLVPSSDHRRTPPDLIAAFKRDCLYARTAYDEASPDGNAAARRARQALHAAAEEQRRLREQERTAQKAREDARLDAIARQVNERLRTASRSPAIDLAAPHRVGTLGMGGPTGMSR
jgi:hypothetical protein